MQMLYSFISAANTTWQSKWTSWANFHAPDPSCLIKLTVTSNN